jgi:hypothetical protein
MALEKQKKLRKMEIIFTEGEVNPVCHCEYDVEVLEDGQLLTKSKHRENMEIADARSMIAQARILQYQEEQF